MPTLVYELPDVLEKEAAKLLDGSTDSFHVKLKGNYKEALVCTDRRVAIIKVGYMTGNTFGPNIMQLAYSQVSSVDVHTGWNAYLEISTGGVNAFTKRSVTGQDSPQRAKNCITLPGRGGDRFREAAALILDRIHIPVLLGRSSGPEASSASKADELRKLADLVNEGILTADEFAAQKALVLGVRPTEHPAHRLTEGFAFKDETPSVGDEADAEFPSTVEAREPHRPHTGFDGRRPVFGKRV